MSSVKISTKKGCRFQVFIPNSGEAGHCKGCLLLDRCMWLGQQAVVLCLREASLQPIAYTCMVGPFSASEITRCLGQDCLLPQLVQDMNVSTFTPVLLNHVHLGGSSHTWLGELDAQIGEKTALYRRLSENEMNSVKASFSPWTGKTRRTQWT